MCRDFQNIYAFLILFCFKVIIINSKTSTLWRLNSDKTKIVDANPFHPVISGTEFTEEDPLFHIIASTEHVGQSWVKQPIQNYCSDCQKTTQNQTDHPSTDNTKSNPIDDVLDCGKPVNFTYFDNLVGVSNRHRHPIMPEPQAIQCFTKNYAKKYDINDFDIDSLEKKLRKTKKEKPKSMQLYNQIGNFWRIKGDARKAIECFRRVLSTSPHHSEVLLNLARVLFSLQYLDDAIYLTRRSLEVLPSEKGAWLQYYTLGEIFRAYGHYQEASMQLKRALDINPGFEPALLLLKEMETVPATTIHIYTLVIIVCLVLGVLLVILSSMDTIIDYSDDIKPQRHFNKAMAMRSIRGITMTAKRCKRPLS